MAARRIALVFVLFSVLLTAAQLDAQRVRIEVAAGAGCEVLSARYIALLDGEGSGVVVSGASFPGARRVSVSANGAPDERVPGFPGVEVKGTVEGELWMLLGRELGGAKGCVGFDKERFTWASDVLTYVSYLAGVLSEAQRFDPSQTTLVAADRTVALEVRRPGRDRALLRGVEGGMLGYGRHEDEVRYFFVPLLLGADGDTMLLRVLRNQSSAFAERGTESIAWVMIDREGPVVTATEPSFEIRRID